MGKLKTTIFLRLKIIELLNNQTDYITMRQIHRMLKDYGMSIIRNTCLELQLDIEALYSSEEMTLLITKRDGIRLIRNGVNTQRLTEAFFKRSSSYGVLCALFLQEEVTTADFCEEQFISKSSLSRRLKELNSLLNVYGLHVSLSEYMSLRGPESRIRMFYHVYFHVVHKGVTHLPWISNTDPSFQLSQQLLTYLKLKNTQDTLSDIYSLVYIISERIKRKHYISVNDPAIHYFNFYEFMAKPNFLEEWCDYDWQLLLLSFYILDVPNNAYFTKKKITSIFKKESQLWLNTFETHVSVLSDDSKKFIISALDRQLQLYSLFPMNYLLLEILELIQLDNFEQDFPEYLNCFNHFWHHLTNSSKLFRDSECLKLFSLLNCIAILDLIIFNPKIKIFVLSNVTQLHKLFIEKRINYHLNKYMVEFVSSEQEADLIISTLEFSKEAQPTQKVIQICASLSNSDLETITLCVDALSKS